MLLEKEDVGPDLPWRSRKKVRVTQRLGAAEACAGINLKDCHVRLTARRPSRKQVSVLCVATRQEESVVTILLFQVSCQAQASFQNVWQGRGIDITCWPLGRCAACPRGGCESESSLVMFEVLDMSDIYIL